MAPSRVKVTSIRRFEKWVKANIADPDQYDKIDWATEIGNDLTCSEMIEMALYKFPVLWKREALPEHTRRIKRIIFIKSLMDKIQQGEIQATYRKTPKFGVYYVVDNRFRTKDGKWPIIEFYKTEKVNPYELTNDQAKLAGINKATEIIELFEKWYGKPTPELFRNWFVVKEST